MLNPIKQIVTTIYTAAIGSGSREVAMGGVTAMAGVLGSVAGLLGGWDRGLLVLIVLIVGDYGTGVLGAMRTKTVSSEVMFWGGVRKAVLLFIVGLCSLMDDWIQPGIPIFRTAAIYFYAGREGLSIVENLGVLGVPLPQEVKNFLLQLSDDKSKNNPAKPEHPDNDQSA
ncbi:holin family protein [Paenibacillus sp. NFR01]|uniref:phage holin family protein n=1 Tax=Paenibacillus sp. NFR01 TaxID=1566279 RepID=UPI0008D1C011|nr:phage holin family protein [Paenibacillus sp. NFR01]SEU26523.1 toxin secretion/phage lysis holin [Paenibacillus sp. NFR01]